MKQVFDLVFDDCIRDKDFDSLPAYPGIYLFRITSKTTSGEWSLRIVYIGKTEPKQGLRGHVDKSHEHLNDARKAVKDAGNGAFLTIAYTDKNPQLEKNDWLQRAEAALIFARKPQINTDGKDSFNYDETELNISGGRHNDLSSHYLVKKGV